MQKSSLALASEKPEITGLSENKIAAFLYKQRQQEYKDREYDSDDDLRKEMMTFDDRLTYINKLDQKIFGSSSKKEEEKPKKTADEKATTAEAAGESGE